MMMMMLMLMMMRMMMMMMLPWSSPGGPSGPSWAVFPFSRVALGTSSLPRRFLLTVVGPP
eukprot:9067294-Pyramimonas_sp.AAC.1